MFKIINQKILFILTLCFAAQTAVSALTFNDIKSTWHKVKHTATGKTIITVNAATDETKNCTLYLTKKGKTEKVLEIKIGGAGAGMIWTPSYTKEKKLADGDYDVYFDPSALEKEYHIEVRKQSRRHKVASFFTSNLVFPALGVSGRVLGHANREERAPIKLETIRVGGRFKRGLSRTYTIHTTNLGLGDRLVIKCASADTVL